MSSEENEMRTYPLRYKIQKRPFHGTFEDVPGEAGFASPYGHEGAYTRIGQLAVARGGSYLGPQYRIVSMNEIEGAALAD